MRGWALERSGAVRRAPVACLVVVAWRAGASLQRRWGRGAVVELNSKRGHRVARVHHLDDGTLRRAIVETLIGRFNTRQVAVSHEHPAPTDERRARSTLLQPCRLHPCPNLSAPR